MPTTPAPEPHPLLDARADGILAAALGADGVRLRGLHRTGIHPRGGRLSVRFVAEVDGADAPELDLVAHTAEGPVPPGAAVVRAAGHDVHVWRVPHDPYLPGLAAAVSPVRVRSLLDELGLPSGEVTLVTRAYRPTRRAVVEVRLAAGREQRVLFLKVLGGGDGARVRERAEALATVHRALTGVVPVPRLIGVSPDQGLVAITAVPGVTLRTALVLGHAVPDPADLVALSERLAEAEVASSADPRRYADVTRHVRLLAEAVPDLAGSLEEAAAFAATVRGPTGTVHGDLHDGQVLVTGGAVTGLLDVDGVGTGLVAQDAGRLVAFLESAAEVERADPARIADYVERLAAAYGALGVERRDLAAGAAAAWVGLATAPYRARPERWQDRVRQRVERALGWARSDTG